MFEEFWYIIYASWDERDHTGEGRFVLEAWGDRFTAAEACQRLANKDGVYVWAERGTDVAYDRCEPAEIVTTGKMIASAYPEGSGEED